MYSETEGMEATMGAETFIQSAKGRTAEEAFRSAREDALHEYGHRGYTGSIAEKRSFKMIGDTWRDVKARLEQAIAALREVLRETAKPEVEPAAALEAARRRIGVQVELDCWGLERAPKVKARAAIRAEIERLRKLKAGCRASMKPADLAELLIDLGDPRIDDKWGPAGCIDLAPKKKRDKEFLFFGWASS